METKLGISKTDFRGEVVPTESAKYKLLNHPLQNQIYKTIGRLFLEAQTDLTNWRVKLLTLT